jgi:hypothetical protein
MGALKVAFFSLLFPPFPSISHRLLRGISLARLSPRLSPSFRLVLQHTTCTRPVTTPQHHNTTTPHTTPQASMEKLDLPDELQHRIRSVPLLTPAHPCSISRAAPSLALLHALLVFGPHVGTVPLQLLLRLPVDRTQGRRDGGARITRQMSPDK